MGTDTKIGLTEQQASAARARHGPNIIVPHRPSMILRIFFYFFGGRASIILSEFSQKFLPPKHLFQIWILIRAGFGAILWPASIMMVICYEPLGGDQPAAINLVIFLIILYTYNYTIQRHCTRLITWPGCCHSIVDSHSIARSFQRLSRLVFIICHVIYHQNAALCRHCYKRWCSARGQSNVPIFCAVSFFCDRPSQIFGLTRTDPRLRSSTRWPDHVDSWRQNSRRSAIDHCRRSQNWSVSPYWRIRTGPGKCQGNFPELYGGTLTTEKILVN